MVYHQFPHDNFKFKVVSAKVWNSKSVDNSKSLPGVKFKRFCLPNPLQCQRPAYLRVALKHVDACCSTWLVILWWNTMEDQ